MSVKIKFVFTVIRLELEAHIFYSNYTYMLQEEILTK